MSEAMPDRGVAQQSGKVSGKDTVSSASPQSRVGSNAGTVHMFEGADGPSGVHFCNMCGTKLREGEAFCTQCGAPVKMKTQSSPARNTNPPAYPPALYGASAAGKKKKALIYAAVAFGLLICAVFAVLFATGVFSEKTILASRDEEKYTQDASDKTDAPAEMSTMVETSTAAEISAAPYEENNLIILSNAFYTAPYCTLLNESAIAKGEEMGYEVQVLDGQIDANMQLDHARTAIETAAGFIYLPIDVESSVIVLEVLREADFPCIVISNYTREAAMDNNVTCFVGSDMTKHGENLAQAVSDLLPAGGNIVEMGGMAGNSLSVAVDVVLDEEFTTDPDIILLTRQYTNFDSETAYSMMADMLAIYGDGIDLVIAHSPEICTGVISALEAAGVSPGDIPIVTIGSNAIIMDGILGGWITCTSTQDPAMESALGVEALVNILNGETVEQIITINHDLCDIDDIDNYHWF